MRKTSVMVNQRLRLTLKTENVRLFSRVGKREKIEKLLLAGAEKLTSWVIYDDDGTNEEERWRLIA